MLYVWIAVGIKQQCGNPFVTRGHEATIFYNIDRTNTSRVIETEHFNENEIEKDKR